jgi:hypothetical protein
MFKRFVIKLWAVAGCWLIWGLAFTASLLPPFTHHWGQIETVIEALRYPWGLTPAELLFLRWLGELSHWVPVMLLLILVGAVRYKHARNLLIAAGAAMSTLFLSIYCAYSRSNVSSFGKVRAEQ